MGTYERLQAIICTSLNLAPEQVSPGTMAGEIGDDLDWYLVVIEVEVSFHIDIAESEFDRVRNVAELVELIDAKLTAREAA